MANYLRRAVFNLKGTLAYRIKILDLPTEGFDKCVVTNILIANKSALQDQIKIELVTPDAKTITVLPNIPVDPNDAFSTTPETKFNLGAGDQLWATGVNAGQNLDIIVSYLFADNT